MTNHERYRELAALDLYGELDDGERRELEGHLETCVECTAFAGELREWLGRVSPAAREDELPVGWQAALEARIERELRRSTPLRGGSLWIGFAAGLAAGVLVMLYAGRSAGSGSPPGSFVATYSTNAAPLESPVELDAPPPRTTSRGRLALLGRALGQ